MSKQSSRFRVANISISVQGLLFYIKPFDHVERYRDMNTIIHNFQFFKNILLDQIVMIYLKVLIAAWKANSHRKRGPMQGTERDSVHDR